MPPSDPRNVFTVNLPAIPNQTFHFTFHPACPGPVRVDISLSPLGTQGHFDSAPTPGPARISEPVAVSPPRLQENTSTPTHIFAAASPPRLDDSSIPTHVSVAVSPFRLGDSSTLQRVSRAVSPIPFRVLDLLPSDFPFSDLSEDSEDPDMIYETPAPPPSTRNIAPDLKQESVEEIRPFKAQARSQDIEIISETEPESVTEPESD